MNKKISFSIALAVIIVLAVLAGGLILYSNKLEPEEELLWFPDINKNPEEKLENNIDESNLINKSTEIDNYIGNDFKFTGKISEVNHGCFYDLTCYIVVNKERTVVYGEGWSNSVWGKTSGELEVGKEVEVFAHVEEQDNLYSLAGNKDYYIKVIE